MPVELAPAIELPVPPRSPIIYPPRKRWTRADRDRVEAAGVWGSDRLELIEGELIVKTSKKRPHTVVYASVLEWLAGVFGMKHLNPEAPIDVAPEDTLVAVGSSSIGIRRREPIQWLLHTPRERVCNLWRRRRHRFRLRPPFRFPPINCR